MNKLECAPRITRISTNILVVPIVAVPNRGCTQSWLYPIVAVPNRGCTQSWLYPIVAVRNLAIGAIRGHLEIAFEKLCARRKEMLNTKQFVYSSQHKAMLVLTASAVFFQVSLAVVRPSIVFMMSDDQMAVSNPQYDPNKALVARKAGRGGNRTDKGGNRR